MKDHREDGGKAKGGRARAEALSPDQRVQIARLAAAARWDDITPRATHYGDLKIGDITIPSAVLQDGTRVITQRGMFVALGRHKDQRRDKPRSTTGQRFFWRPTIFLPLFQRSWSDGAVLSSLSFREARGVLGAISPLDMTPEFFLSSAQCFLGRQGSGRVASEPRTYRECVQGNPKRLSIVGIIALIDEVTGYQEVRDRDALRQILEQYFQQELAAWVKRFPDEFYREIYRLRDWPWQGMGKNRYSVVAHYTKDLIYERLAPGVLEEMERRNPKTEDGSRRAKHHQWLSEDLGIPKLQEHFAAVLALQKAHDDWDSFYAAMQRALPRGMMCRLLQYGGL